MSYFILEDEQEPSFCGELQFVKKTEAHSTVGISVCCKVVRWEKQKSRKFIFVTVSFRVPARDDT